MAWCAHNSKSALGLTVLAVLLAAWTVDVCQAGDAVMSQAESALRTKLQVAYPAVSRWNVTPLPEQWRASAVLEREHIARPTVFVTRVGARSAVWIGTSPEGGAPLGALLWFSVEGDSPALVATHPVPAGAALVPGDGELAEADIVAAACPPLTDAARLTGMRAGRMLRAGEVICAAAVEPMPPVARGEEVMARFSSHGVVVTTRAVAESDGFMGGPVTVRNASGGAVFGATVTGKAEVAVND